MFLPMFFPQLRAAARMSTNSSLVSIFAPQYAVLLPLPLFADASQTSAAAPSFSNIPRWLDADDADDGEEEEEDGGGREKMTVLGCMEPRPMFSSTVSNPSLRVEAIDTRQKALIFALCTKSFQHNDRCTLTSAGGSCCATSQWRQADKVCECVRGGGGDA